MGWLTHDCPRCGGPLEATGYSAPYPTHRCRRCMDAAAKDAKIKELEARLEKIEAKS